MRQIAAAILFTIPSVAFGQIPTTPANTGGLAQVGTAADTSGLVGDGTFVERLTGFVERLEIREMQGVLRAKRSVNSQIAGALQSAGTYLDSHRNDTQVLILAARLGRLQRAATSLVLSRGVPPSRETMFGWCAPYHAYLDRALAIDRTSAEAHYWKARLYGMSSTTKTDFFGTDEPPDSTAAMFRAQADSAERFARRAVELAPHELPYREALAMYLLSNDRPDEAVTTLRDVAGGRHPIYVLLTDRQMLPLPPNATPWPQQTRLVVSMQREARIDYADLRVRAFALPAPASQVEAFLRTHWPDLRLFPMDSKQSGDTRTRTFAQFLHRQGTALEPARAKRDVKTPESPDGFLLVTEEITNPPEQVRRNLPVAVGDVFCILTVMDLRRVR